MTINNALTTAPLFFVRSGFVNSGSTLRNPGSEGDYWSRSANGSSYAFALYFSYSNVYPSYNVNRYYGFSLRCLYAI